MAAMRSALPLHPQSQSHPYAHPPPNQSRTHLTNPAAAGGSSSSSSGRLAHNGGPSFASDSAGSIEIEALDFISPIKSIELRSIIEVFGGRSIHWVWRWWTCSQPAGVDCRRAPIFYI